MSNQYETVFILTPVLSETQVKEAVKKYLDYIGDNGGEIVHQEDWGLRKLAYPIQKKTTGFYYLVEFKSEGDFVEKLETQYRRDEKVIRFLTFRMDKHAIAYAEKRRNLKQQKQEQSQNSVSHDNSK
ncbi:MAG: 30S ribosomal protein S6 [Prevotellaceae bacterium]|jgi:small subunit ribosomal protein S6|nr:30S ribosomal protein S6 [Prevotellaceae bacterium]